MNSKRSGIDPSTARRGNSTKERVDSLTGGGGGGGGGGGDVAGQIGWEISYQRSLVFAFVPLNA